MKKNKTITGLLLIAILAAFYAKFDNKKLIKDELTKINGIINNQPKLEETAGTHSIPYIDLVLKKTQKKFRISYCSLEASYQQKILNLSPGDKLSIWVKEKDFNKEEKGVDKYVESLSPEVFKIINLENNEQLLTLSDFNDCHVNSWKIFLIPIVIFSAILIYRMLKEKKRQEGRA